MQSRHCPAIAWDMVTRFITRYFLRIFLYLLFFISLVLFELLQFQVDHDKDAEFVDGFDVDSHPERGFAQSALFGL